MARDSKTGAPLECLHVVLADSADHAVAHTVTDSAGRFMLEAPHAGTYRVRFEIYGWEPLMGPLDTLAEGSFKQRRYPLDFEGILLPKNLPRRTVFDSAESVRAEHDRQEREAYLRFYRELNAREDSTAWMSRAMLPIKTKVRYPRELYDRRLQGFVVAQVIIDSTGKARSETWQPIRAAHRRLREGCPGRARRHAMAAGLARGKTVLRAGSQRRGVQSRPLGEVDLVVTHRLDLLRSELRQPSPTHQLTEYRATPATCAAVLPPGPASTSRRDIRRRGSDRRPPARRDR